TSQGLYGYYGNPATAAAVAAAAAAAMHFPSASYPTNAVLPTSPMGLQHQQLLAPYQMPPLPPAVRHRGLSCRRRTLPWAFLDTRASCCPHCCCGGPARPHCWHQPASHFSRHKRWILPLHCGTAPPSRQATTSTSITSTSICQPLAFITASVRAKPQCRLVPGRLI
uniref:OAR domain-containing protein n=1 Tax=Macrostomum lignano TaxID=282301 RepID=A0A1I8FH45_9PLAT